LNVLIEKIIARNYLVQNHCGTAKSRNKNAKLQQRDTSKQENKITNETISDALQKKHIAPIYTQGMP
jgi:hypothetical protein